MREEVKPSVILCKPHELESARLLLSEIYLVDSASGLDEPEQPKATEKTYGPYELQINREKASELLRQLMNLPEVRGAHLDRDPTVAVVRMAMVRFVGKNLLGPDWDCEILC